MIVICRWDFLFFTTSFGAYFDPFVLTVGEAFLSFLSHSISVEAGTRPLSNRVELFEAVEVVVRAKTEDRRNEKISPKMTILILRTYRNF